MRYLLAVLAITAVVGAWVAAQEPANNEVPPLVFELSINGESFLIEPDTQNELKSKSGAVYKVALRLARQQRWVLNTVRFDYDGGFSVDDDNQRDNRTATLTHELGFNIVVMDLGAQLAPADRQKVLKSIADSMAASYKKSGATGVTESKPAAVKLAKSAGDELKIDYVDQNRQPSATRVLVVDTGKGAAACIVNYPKAREKELAPLAKLTLDSLRSK